MTTFREVAEQVGQLVTEKDAAYGSAVQTAPQALALLFPDGILPGRYGDASLLVRMWDKMMRIAHRKDAFGESPYRDIAGYGVLGACRDEQPKAGDVKRYLDRSLELITKLRNQGPKTLEECHFLCECGHPYFHHRTAGDQSCGDCPCACVKILPDQSPAMCECGHPHFLHASTADKRCVESGCACRCLKIQEAK